MANQAPQQAKPVVPPVVSPGINDAELDRLLKIEQLQEYQRRRAEAEAKQAEAEAAREAEKARKIDLARTQDRHAKDIFEKQESCIHMSEGKSVVCAMGVWDSHIPYFMCQGCGKTWEKVYPPAHLIPKAEMIGRPQLS